MADTILLTQHLDIHIISENSILRSSAATLPQLLDPDLLYTSPPKTNNTRNMPSSGRSH
jgi:hypothetical protein